MKKKKCYIYTRVSTATQVEGYSLAAQSERLHQFAAYRDLEIVGEYCDAGRSGKSIKGRPQFQQMLEDIMDQKDEISYVLVFKLSRFGRNAADVLKSVQILKDFEVNLVCVEDAIDTSTTGGKLAVSILSAVAELERENIRAQFLAGRMQKLREGGWVGGPVPFGYRNVEGNLAVEPEQAEIVKKIYNGYLKEGKSLTAMVKELNANGLARSVSGDRLPFTYHGVKTILDNPVYCGKFLYYRRTNRGAKRKREILTFPGAHDPIVTEEQWNAAQEKMAERRCSVEADDSERVSLLSGLIKCPFCGRGMVAVRSKKINPNRGGYYKPVYAYVCSASQKQNGCACHFSHSYNQDKVDNTVFEILCGLSMLPQFQQKVVEYLGDQDRIDALEAEIGSLRQQIDKEAFKKDKIGGELDRLDIFDPEYDKKYEQLSEEQDRIYDQLEALEKDLEQRQDACKRIKHGKASAERIVQFLDHIKLLYQHMSRKERREMYRLLIERVEVYPEALDKKIIKSIVFKFPVYYGENKREGRFTFVLDRSDMELTAAEAKATYVQIKDYILETFGAKVSSLYIAQIKRKYGLEMREHYNFSRKPNARVPQCPPQKEAYILDALRHFKMLGT